MVRWRKVGRIAVLLALAAGLALAAAGLAARRVWGLPPGASAAAPGVGGIQITAPAHKQAPLDCRAQPVGIAEQRAELERIWDFDTHPDLLTPQVLRNPLYADLIDLKIENTSGQDFGIYARYKERPFWVYVRIEDADGKPVEFPHAAPSVIKRLGSVPPGEPILTLKPGQVVTLRSSVWRGRLNQRDIPKPGRYTVRFLCDYFRAPDGADCRVESAPFTLTITAEDIRQRRATDAAIHGPGLIEVSDPPDPQVKPPSYYLNPASRLHR